ncbi:hypothetical protein V5799_017513 [Amblyomma americanum]|uniref:Uncharacterized protein n=1 Tax=Amblyomma americanum TaxID=6943 RepID=A0AAQ4F2K0_AMBAM
MTMCFHVGNGMEILDNGENLDIRKAVNTSETLWLYEQTYMNGFYSMYKNKTYFEEETCIRNKMDNISITEYYFTQTMYVKLEEESATTNYKGIFSNDSKSMEVINFDDPREPQLWTLQYQDPENGPCMVFIIQELRPKLGDAFKATSPSQAMADDPPPLLPSVASSVNCTDQPGCSMDLPSELPGSSSFSDSDDMEFDGGYTEIEADVAVGPFSLKVDYLRFLYAAEAHIYEDVPMLSAMRRPYLTGGFSSTDSFPPMTIALLFASMAVLVFLSAWSLVRAHQSWMSAVKVVFWIYAESLLMKSTSTSPLRTAASRILFLAWMIATFVIGQYITGQVSDKRTSSSVNNF